MKDPVQLSLDPNDFKNNTKLKTVRLFNAKKIKKTLEQISGTSQELYSHMFKALENEYLAQFLVLYIREGEENGVVVRIVEMRDIRTNSLISR